MLKPLYPELVGNMAKKGETRADLAKLLNISELSVINKLNGKSEFKLVEIEILCKHYSTDYYELFKKSE